MMMRKLSLNALRALIAHWPLVAGTTLVVLNIALVLSNRSVVLLLASLVSALAIVARTRRVSPKVAALSIGICALLLATSLPVPHLVRSVAFARFFPELVIRFGNLERAKATMTADQASTLQWATWTSPEDPQVAIGVTKTRFLLDNGPHPRAMRTYQAPCFEESVRLHGSYYLFWQTCHN